MGKSITVGIIGRGAMSGHYLATFDTLESIDLIAVADQDPLRAAVVADDGRRHASLMSYSPSVKSTWS